MISPASLVAVQVAAQVKAAQWDAQLQAALFGAQPKPPVKPIDVPCADCGAKPGEECTIPRVVGMHKLRISRASAVTEARNALLK